jgi:hypothetical protein
MATRNTPLLHRSRWPPLPTAWAMRRFVDRAFEVVNKEIRTYDDLLVTIHNLQQEIEWEAEVGEAAV